MTRSHPKDWHGKKGDRAVLKKWAVLLLKAWVSAALGISQEPKRNVGS